MRPHRVEVPKSIAELPFLGAERFGERPAQRFRCDGVWAAEHLQRRWRTAAAAHPRSCRTGGGTADVHAVGAADLRKGACPVRQSDAGRHAVEGDRGRACRAPARACWGAGAGAAAPWLRAGRRDVARQGARGVRRPDAGRDLGCGAAGGWRAGVYRRSETATSAPAEVPTMTSAARASTPTSSIARTTPRWNASPAVPPAPRTSPTRSFPSVFPDHPPDPWPLTGRPSRLDLPVRPSARSRHGCPRQARPPAGPRWHLRCRASPV
jgi:hypothetical protein